MTLDLTDDEARALAKYLRQALDYARFPLLPRLDPLKAILAKLEPACAARPARSARRSRNWNAPANSADLLQKRRPERHPPTKEHRNIRCAGRRMAIRRNELHAHNHLRL